MDDDKEIEYGIREVLRKTFTDTAFRVSYANGELHVDLIGGRLAQYGDNLPVHIEEQIQNAIFEVYPIIMYFEDSTYV